MPRWAGEPPAVTAIDAPQRDREDRRRPAAAVAPDAAKSGAQTVTIIDGKSGTRTRVAVRTR